MRWFYDNEIDVATHTITANSEEASYPLTNLLDYQLTKHYRATGDTSEWVMIDAGAGNTITATFAAIAGHNISDGATTIKIQGNATNSWADPTVNESFTYSSGVMWKTFTSQSLRYWRYLIEDASNPDGYIRFGRLLLGTYFDLTNWAQAAFVRRIVDTSEIKRSATGQIYGDERIAYIEYDFDFPVLANTERVNLETMWETVKKVKPIVLVPNPTDTTLAPIYANISNFEISHIIAWLWQGSMTLTEAL